MTAFLVIEGLERSIYSIDVFESMSEVIVERYEGDKKVDAKRFRGNYKWMLAMTFALRGNPGLEDLRSRMVE